MADDLRTFSIKEARQIAIAAQGFGEPRPKDGTVGFDDFDHVMQTLNIVQIDSVNVLVRAQYMPFFSRLGPYPLGMLHEYAYENRNLFEYYVHEASLIPMNHLPMIRHRMSGWRPWRRWEEVMVEHPNLLESIIQEVKSRGPLAVANIENKGERYGFWSTTTAKLVLETLLHQGVFAVSDRARSARRYDIFERAVPDHISSKPSPSPVEAHRMMMKLAIGSLGIATVADCADYYRIKRTDAAKAFEHLAMNGEVERVAVDTVDTELFAIPGIEPPVKPIDASAIVSPFDPLVWYRSRLEWLFDFEYRIEIYVPVKKRKYGYYVMPFLFGDELAARVDLKADRAKSVLRVPSAFLEEGCDEENVAEKLASELRLMADWLELDRIVIGRRGEFTKALRSAVKRN